MPDAKSQVENIGPRGRRERAVFGALGMLAGWAGVWALHVLGGSHLWLLAVFGVFWLGTVSLLQAYEHT